MIGRDCTVAAAVTLDVTVNRKGRIFAAILLFLLRIKNSARHTRVL